MTVSAEDTTKPSIGALKVDCQVLITSAKVLLLYGRLRMVAMRHRHVKGDIAWSHQKIVARLIVREERVAISEAEGIHPCKFSNRVTGNVC